MQSNLELIRHLKEAGVLFSPLLIESFIAVDRKDFVPASLQDEAYEDYPLPIGEGQTISQPYTVALMLELLELEPNDKVLDIGCGSGWTSALLAQTLTEGDVTAIERVPKLLSLARKNLSPYHFDNLHLELASKELGKPGETFDKILVSAAASILPQELIDQLNPGGIMVIPVNDSIMIIKKVSESDIQEKELQGFRFVPLIY